MARDSRSKGPSGRRSAASRPASDRTTTRPQVKKVAGAGAVAAAKRRDPRSMRRMLIVATILIFLGVVITPTLRNFLNQRSQINDYTNSVAAQQADIAAKQAEAKKWQDPKYVAEQATKRLGFAKPGQQITVVVDPKLADGNGAPTAAEQAAAKSPWYGRLWSSTVNANSAK